MNFKRVMAVAKKEVLHLKRDIRLVMMVLIHPLMLLIIFGYAISLDVKNISVAWMDEEKGWQSFQLKKEITASGYFKINYYCDTYKQIMDLFNRGKAKIAIVIPKDFSKNILQKKSAPVQVILDGSENNICSIALGYLEGIRNHYNLKLSPLRSGIPMAESRLRIWYNPELESSNFIVPGIIAIVLMVLMSLLSAFSISRERESGTLERLSLSPLQPVEIVIGKIVPYIFLGFVDVCLVISAGYLIFGVPVKGNLFLLLPLSILFILVPISLGLLFSTLATSQQTAMMMVSFTTILPTVILSGFVFPVNAMPKWLQAVTVLIPAKYFLIILRGIFLKGVGLDKLLEPAFSLIVLGGAIIIVTMFKLKKMLETAED